MSKHGIDCIAQQYLEVMNQAERGGAELGVPFIERNSREVIATAQLEEPLVTWV